jgi:hypothetical protein
MVLCVKFSRLGSVMCHGISTEKMKSVRAEAVLEMDNNSVCTV